MILRKNYVASGFSYAVLLKINQSGTAGLVKQNFHLLANLNTFKFATN